MRINGTSGIESRGPLESDSSANAGKNQALQPPQPEVDKPASTETTYIQKAQAVPEVDTQAVERATKLLQSGALDTPEACQAAAEGIVDQGL